MTIGRLRIRGTDRRWLVVRTHIHSEEWAYDHLIRQDFDAYLPQYIKSLPATDKTPARRAVRPLFPRYLFVKQNSKWRRIYATYGVHSVLMDGSYPGLVHNSIIEDLRHHERDGYYRMPDEMNVGDRLRIIGDHLFHGHIGFHDGMTKEERIKVLLSVMGKTLKLEVQANNVEAA